MTQSADFFKYQDGILSASGVRLTEIADQVGTPVYIYSAEAILKPLQELQSGLEGLDHLVCFAVKSNSNLAVLRLLSQAGAGLDLVSGGELYRAGAAGVSPDKIVFSGVGKTPGEMARALEAGIFSFNVESVAELQTLSQVAQEMELRARVALRFNPDVDPKTHPYISTGLKKNKFGLNRSEVLQVVKNLENFAAIDLAGLSIHIGSQLLSLAPLGDAFERLRDLVDQVSFELEKQERPPISFVDLGGGVGITYKNEKPPTLKKYCDLIVKNFGPKKVKRPLRVLIEPGRTLSGNAGVLLTEVLYRKARKSKDFLVVDAGMNDLIRPALYESYHEIVPVEKAKASSGKKIKTDIVGPVCESADCFAGDRLLATKIDRGDLLAILSAGAYGFTMACNYNSRPRPPEVLIDKDGKFRVIRTRESYEDLIRGE